MNNEKMTIYYNLRTLEIKTIIEGIQTLNNYKDMSLEDASLIYGILIVDCNKFIMRHKKDFELVKNEAGKIELQLRQESREQFKQFI